MNKILSKLVLMVCFVALANINVSANDKATNDYIAFYHLCNAADSLSYFENEKAALQKFKEAFEIVDYTPVNYLRRASLLAYRLKEYSLAYKWQRLNILQGNPLFDDSVIKQELPHSALDSIKKWQKLHSESIDKDYSKEIDSLYYIDQCFLRDYNCDLPGIDTNDLSKDNMEAIDQSNFLYLIKLIETKGYPTEYRVGVESAEKVWILIHHSVRLSKNSNYIDYFIEEVYKGNYEPHNFAWMYDQSLIFSNEAPYFYYGVADVSYFTDEQKKEVNNRRREWGIKPLESTKIEKFGDNSISQMTLW